MLAHNIRDHRNTEIKFVAKSSISRSKSEEATEAAAKLLNTFLLIQPSRFYQVKAFMK